MTGVLWLDTIISVMTALAVSNFIKYRFNVRKLAFDMFSPHYRKRPYWWSALMDFMVTLLTVGLSAISLEVGYKICASLFAIQALMTVYGAAMNLAVRLNRDYYYQLYREHNPPTILKEYC